MLKQTKELNSKVHDGLIKVLGNHQKTLEIAFEEIDRLKQRVWRLEFAQA